jgi:hypothetical protein
MASRIRSWERWCANLRARGVQEDSLPAHPYVHEARADLIATGIAPESVLGLAKLREAARAAGVELRQCDSAPASQVREAATASGLTREEREQRSSGMAPSAEENVSSGPAPAPAEGGGGAPLAPAEGGGGVPLAPAESGGGVPPGAANLGATDADVPRPREHEPGDTADESASEAELEDAGHGGQPIPGGPTC